VLVVNTAMVDRPVARTDLRVVAVDATREASALSTPTVANTVLVGALLRVVRIVSVGAVRHAPSTSHHLSRISSRSMSPLWIEGWTRRYV
jgi:hypothetical protein